MSRAEEIRQNLRDVRSRVEASARAAGRDPSSITLVAVSKTKPVEDIRAAWDAGQRDFGENYAQELATKREALQDLVGLRWHFIGALQSNKAKLVVPSALVHAVDRPSVAEALSRRALGGQFVQDVLIEVNVGGEASKAGVAPAELDALAATIAALPALRLRGLMCIPPPVEDEATQRAYFGRLRAERERLRSLHPALDLLSMGMSDDFPLAIAEGATHVRVGTAIFGARG